MATGNGYKASGINCQEEESPDVLCSVCGCQRRFMQSNSTQPKCSVSLQIDLCVLLAARVCSDHGFKTMLELWFVEQVFACLLFVEQGMCLLYTTHDAACLVFLVSGSIA